ncbi:CHAT domain-containing tetratricopeptide repeat protein [Leptolyngbya sp. AN02str]
MWWQKVSRVAVMTLVLSQSGWAIAPGLSAEVIAVQPAQSSSNASAEAERLLGQGAAQFQQRQWQAAQESWQRALQLYRQAGNRVGEGRVLGNLAAIAEAQGNDEQALALFQQSFEIARELNDARGQSFALINLGYVATNLGDYERAIAHLEMALPITRASNDASSEYSVLNQLGIVYRIQGQYEAAIAQLQQAAALARSLGEVVGEANALGNLGNTYTDQGSYPAALSHYESTLALMRQVQNRVGEAGVLQRLGVVASLIGDRTRAEVYFTQSLEMANNLGDRRMKAQTLGNLGIVYSNTNRFERAVTALNEGLGLARQLSDRSLEGDLLHSLGNVYAAQQAYPTATAYYTQSLEISRQLGKRSNEGYTLGALAIVYDQTQDDERAIATYEDAIAILQDVGDRAGEGKALSNLGITLFDLGRPEAAVAPLQQAIAIWDSLRPGLSDADQISLFETQANTYRTLQRVLIELKRFDEALEISERSRSRAFVELVAQRLSAQAAERFQTEPLAIEDMQAIARREAATLVEYSILSSTELAIWVIQPNGTVHFRTTTLANVEESITEVAEETRVAAALGRGANPNGTWNALVSDTRSAITTSRVDPVRAVSSPSAPQPSEQRRLSRKLHNLHEILIAPIADLLPTSPTEEVVFIPQSTLFLVPFAALQAADGTYVIERHTIRTAPGIQVLGLARSRSEAQAHTGDAFDTTRSLIVGNPIMPSVGEPPQPLGLLPYAESEARAIADLLDTEAMIGAAATEDRVRDRLKTAEIIHLATHGLLDDLGGLGIPGALALTPTATSDGLLTANEILELSLEQASLVVLSACDTGRGRITGDGVVGLSRSFLSAGAPSVIVSLWAVPDESTATLMTALYQHLQHTPNKAQALRQAMLTTMQQYPSSRDWAAFTLLGAAD